MNIRGQIYVKFYPLSERLPSRIRSVWSAVWLGFMNNSALDYVTMSSYKGESGFDAPDHNIGGLWSWEEAAVEEFFKGCNNILVAACGGGREMIALAKRGITVTGFDCGEDLTRACRMHLESLGLEGHVIDALPNAVPSNLGEFDGIIIGRGSYHHVVGSPTRIEYLRQLRCHVQDSAPLLLFDFLQQKEKSGRVYYFIADLIRRIRFGRERVESGDILGSCFFHKFNSKEIESELVSAGFRLKEYRRSPFSEESSLGHAIGIAD